MCFCWSAQLGFSFTNNHSFDNRTPAWRIILITARLFTDKRPLSLSHWRFVSENREPCSHFFSFDNNNRDAADRRDGSFVPNEVETLLHLGTRLEAEGAKWMCTFLLMSLQF